MEAAIREPRRKEILKWLYLATMLLHLLSFPYMMLTYNHFDVYRIPMAIWLLRIVSSVLALYLGKLHKDRGFQILSLYVLYLLLRTVLSNPADLFMDRFSESILTGIWAFTACYGLRKILPGQTTKTVLKTGAAIWTAVMALSCAVAIYAAWDGHRIYTAGDIAFWGLYPRRLMFPYLPTTSGALAALSAMITLCAAVWTKTRTAKILYGLALVPILLALALTDSRTAFVSFAAGAAAFTFLCLTKRTGTKHEQTEITTNQTTQTTKTIQTKRILIALALSLLLCAGIIFLFMRAEDAFHAMRNRGLLIPHALAEASENTSVARGFSGGSEMLTGRGELWKGTIQYLFQNPLILLFGAGKADPMGGINAFLDSGMAHTHNLPLMILTESGVIGIALLLLFIIHVTKQFIRKQKGSTSFYPLLLVSILFTVVIGDTGECFAWMASSSFPTLPFLMTLAGIFCSGNREEDEQPDTGEGFAFLKQRWNKALTIVLVCSLLCTFAAEIIAGRISANEHEYQNTVFSDGSEAYGVHDCEIDDHTMTVTGEDPHFTVSAHNQTFSRIRIAFREPVDEKKEIKIYYVPVGGSVSEKNTTETVVEPGSNQAFLYIPRTACEELRVDIEQDVRLEGIYIGDREWAVKPYSLNLIRIVLIFLLVFLPPYLFIQKRNPAEKQTPAKATTAAKTQTKTPKHTINPTILLCNAFASLTVIFFQPLSYILTNSDFISLSFNTLWPTQFLLAAGITLVLTYLMHLLPKKGGEIAAAVPLGFGIAYLAQTLLFNEGRPLCMHTNWPMDMLNLHVWFGILLLALALAIHTARTPDKEEQKTAKIVKTILASALILVQAFNIIILATEAEPTSSGENQNQTQTQIQTETETQNQNIFSISMKQGLPFLIKDQFPTD